MDPQRIVPRDVAAALTAFDPRSPRFAADPYPVFEAACTAGTPLWHDGLGMWLAFRHADASAALRAKTLGRIFRPREPEQHWDTFNWLHADSILDSEPPKHTRLKRLVSKAFTRSYIETLRPLVEQTCTTPARPGRGQGAHRWRGRPRRGLRRAAARDDHRGDARRAGADQHLLRPWSQDIVKMYEYDRTPEQEEDARRSSGEFAAYVADLAGQRRHDPTRRPRDPAGAGPRGLRTGSTSTS